MAAEIIIYGKAGWPYTKEARKVYGDKASYIDVEQDSEKLQEMLNFTGGLRKLPVLVKDGEVTIGYGGTW